MWCRNVPPKVSSSYRVCLSVCLLVCNEAAFSSKRRNSEGSGASRRLAPPIVFLPRFLRANSDLSVRLSVDACLVTMRTVASPAKRSHWHFSFNPSGCTVALGSTQPLTEMSTKWVPNEYQKYFLGGWRRPVRDVDKFTTFMSLLSRNSGSLNLLWAFISLQPSRPVQE
jgi:hypothetical protein